jgi:hypothetical protein
MGHPDQVADERAHALWCDEDTLRQSLHKTRQHRRQSKQRERKRQDTRLVWVYVKRVGARHVVHIFTTHESQG